MTITLPESQPIATLATVDGGTEHQMAEAEGRYSDGSHSVLCPFHVIQDLSGLKPYPGCRAS